MTKVITYGTYDLLHDGHIRLLKRAKELGDYLIVGVTSDDYDIARGKINNQQSLMERVAAVKATGIADEIIVEEYEGQKIDDIRRMNVGIFTVGSDWEGKFDYLKEYCQVIYLPRTEGISSTGIRSENRKICIGILGDNRLGEKFIREIQYVNGVDYRRIGNLTKDEMKSVDAVYIVTHPKYHYEDVKNAILNGKHVICESPVALTVSQCIELQELAQKKGLILIDGIKTAYSTAYSRMLGIVKSGRIGDVVSVDSVCTSMEDGVDIQGVDLEGRQNSICAWGPTAMLPIFQLLGSSYKNKIMVTRLLDKEINYDAFTKVSFLFDKSVASFKVAKAAKSEGELIITGTKGYIYVPAPWWKTDYFEVRFENPADNKRFFYQLDGEGIRYEIVAFIKAIETGKGDFYIDSETTRSIVEIIEAFENKKYEEI